MSDAPLTIADYAALANSTPELVGPSEANIAEVVALARWQLELQRGIEGLEAALKEKKAQLALVAETQLPNAMRQASMRSYQLDSGETVRIKETCVANVKKEDRAEVCDWLEANGHGDLVKRTVSVAFGRDEEALMQRFIGYLRGMAQLRGRVTVDRRVEWQTLGAFVREQLALAEKLKRSLEFPRAFGVTPLREAEVKPPAKKRPDFSF